MWRRNDVRSTLSIGEQTRKQHIVLEMDVVPERIHESRRPEIQPLPALARARRQIEAVGEIHADAGSFGGVGERAAVSGVSVAVLMVCSVQPDWAYSPVAFPWRRLNMY